MLRRTLRYHSTLLKQSKSSIVMNLREYSIIGAQTLEMKYLEGNCSISIPLPLNGFDEERIFSLNTEMPVKEIIASIEKEDEAIQKVQLRSLKGKPFEDQMKLDEIITDDFQLLINDYIMTVRAPVYTGDAYLSVQDNGELDVRAITQKYSIIDFRQALETHPRWKITFEEFVELAEQYGIPNKQAKELIQVFHNAGVLFYFDQAQDFKNYVFLQPRNIIDRYLDSIKLTPISKQLLLKHREAIEGNIKTMEPELKALTNLHATLDHSASNFATGVCYASSTSLVGCFSLYAWLSFVHFSWDIMEPVTYFTGFGVSIIGYTWWSITNQEYEFENIYDYIFSKRMNKLYKRTNFDLERFEALKRAMMQENDKLKQVEIALKKPVTLQANYVDLCRK